MVHETWVGFTTIATWKHRIWGGAQRMIFIRLHRTLKPILVHTSIPLYSIMLRRSGVEVKLLPIPSNIVKEDGAVGRLTEEFAALGIESETRSQWTVLGSFGTIHPAPDYHAFFESLGRQTMSRGRKLAVLTMGRVGPAGRSVCTEIERVLSGKGMVHQFGERSPAEVSAFLQLLDLGLSTIPEFFLGKSTSYAAMRLHKLEVLVPRKPELPDYSDDLKAFSGNQATSLGENFAPENAAAKFLNDLHQFA